MPKVAGKDNFGFGSSVSSQARKAIVVVPSDSVDLDNYAKALYIGVSGDVKCIPIDNLDADPVVFKNHPIGYMSCIVRRVYATGTTATNILALI